MLVILMALFVAFSVCACAGEQEHSGVGSPVLLPNSQSSEERGVPQSQIQADVSSRSTKVMYTVTNCTHNVDTTQHQDNVLVEYCATNKYMRTDYVQNFVYQYDRTSDLWTLISKGENSYNYVLLDNLKGTKWSGISETIMGSHLSYTITVNSINQANEWINFTYDIHFAGKDYQSTMSMDYGEFVLARVENKFRITFDPDDGFSVSRN